MYLGFTGVGCPLELQSAIGVGGPGLGVGVRMPPLNGDGGVRLDLSCVPTGRSATATPVSNIHIL